MTWSTGVPPAPGIRDIIPISGIHLDNAKAGYEEPSVTFVS